MKTEVVIYDQFFKVIHSSKASLPTEMITRNLELGMTNG